MNRYWSILAAMMGSLTVVTAPVHAQQAQTEPKTSAASTTIRLKSSNPAPNVNRANPMEEFIVEVEPSISNVVTGGASPILILIPNSAKGIAPLIQNVTPPVNEDDLTPATVPPPVTDGKSQLATPQSTFDIKQIQGTIPGIPEGWWDNAIIRLLTAAKRRYKGLDYKLNLQAETGKTFDTDNDQISNVRLTFNIPLMDRTMSRTRKEERQAFIEQGTSMIREAKNLSQMTILRERNIQFLVSHYQSRPSREMFKMVTAEQDRLVKSRQRSWELKILFDQLVR
ncbi:hypothetical protein [Magnetococcus sp. PR-3]|uniref:hypothetical protein n=1 Tax=Magnetococcus sp. PR-3 TaxID=3120355 RepID=UPI002FCDF3D3